MIPPIPNHPPENPCGDHAPDAPGWWWLHTYGAIRIPARVDFVAGALSIVRYTVPFQSIATSQYVRWNGPASEADVIAWTWKLLRDEIDTLAQWLNTFGPMSLRGKWEIGPGLAAPANAAIAGDGGEMRYSVWRENDVFYVQLDHIRLPTYARGVGATLITAWLAACEALIREAQKEKCDEA